ncbi:MAG TPA: ABC transporter substrate-binding protein [Gemmatimonadales bacterium]|nr:ABC transporter substrate-binding protein [Gemmatimonadales bacterium]
MRVLTLLPAATEIVAALGGAGQLVGISHECDYPASVQRLPRVTATPVDVRAPGVEIDAAVRRISESGRAVIGIDAAILRRLAPDLIITQTLCDVCAVSGSEAHQIGATMSPIPRVLALHGQNLTGIWADIRSVGEALDLEEESEELVLGLQSRLRRLRARPVPSRPRVVCIEWLEPLYLAGHWVPELVRAAGGEDVGSLPGSHSARHEWGDVKRLHPDHALIMLCGFDVERSRQELETLRDAAALSFLAEVNVSIIDGNAYTSRAGPRIVDGAERIHSALNHQPARGLEPWLPSLR